MYKATNNSVTPLIGQALSDAGYDAEYSLKPHKLYQPPLWEAVMNYNHPKLNVKKTVLLDFGAAGKGYLIDIVAQLLNKNNIYDFCIDAGGDIKHSNPNNKIIKVGLEHPGDFSKVIGISEISNKSICGSSGNRRKWGDFNHIIDPYTLSSPKNILSTWAIADDAILADGMTTCLFFISGKKLTKTFNFEYLILFDDYSYDASSNFPAEVYTSVGSITK
jgi:FAD:protein FMN transferase